MDLLYTVNDLTRRPLKGMRKSALATKALEGSSKKEPRHANLIRMVTKVTASTNDAWIVNLRSTGI